jgi:hypothetical protein
MRHELLFEDNSFSLSKKYFWAFQASRAVNESVKSIMQEWREYRKRTIDSGQAWNMHIGSRQDAGLVDSSGENRRRILRVADKIEESMAELAAILEANCKRQDELVASRDGVSYSY